MYSAKPSSAAAAASAARSPRFAATPPQTTSAARPSQRERPPRLPHQHVDDRGLEAGAKIVHLLPLGQRAPRASSVATAVLSPEKLKSRSSRPGSARGNGDRPRVAGRRRACRSRRRPDSRGRASCRPCRTPRPAASSRVDAEQPRLARTVDRGSAPCGRPTPAARGAGTSGGACGAGGSSRNAAARWPARWFTPTSGLPSANASAFAVSTPTSSAPTRPGPAVTAIASRSRSAMPASRDRALRATGHDGRDVLARRDLRDDAAVGRVRRDLRRDDVRRAPGARPRRPRRPSRRTTSRRPGPAFQRPHDRPSVTAWRAAAR